MDHSTPSHGPSVAPGRWRYFAAPYRKLVSLNPVGFGSFGALVVLLVIGFGCSHSREAELREMGMVGNYAAEPPTFLTGPMGVLLTNGSGYSARATIQNEALGSAQGATSGQLFCRGSKLLFAPVATESKKKRAREGGFAFIWDVSTGRGFVLSGALQAY